MTGKLAVTSRRPTTQTGQMEKIPFADNLLMSVCQSVSRGYTSHCHCYCDRDYDYDCDRTLRLQSCFLATMRCAGSPLSDVKAGEKKGRICDCACH